MTTTSPAAEIAWRCFWPSRNFGGDARRLEQLATRLERRGAADGNVTLALR